MLRTVQRLRASPVIEADEAEDVVGDVMEDNVGDGVGDNSVVTIIDSGKVAQAAMVEVPPRSDKMGFGRSVGNL